MRQDGVFEFDLMPPQTHRGNLSAIVAQLTPKERKVADLVARGLTNKETAREMGGMSPHTVATHLRRAYVKLHVNSRDELARLFEATTRPQ